MRVQAMTQVRIAFQISVCCDLLGVKRYVVTYNIYIGSPYENRVELGISCLHMHSLF